MRLKAIHAGLLNAGANGGIETVRPVDSVGRLLQSGIRVGLVVLLTTLLLATSHARPGTQPPSVALRTALSYVVVADLASVQDKDGSTQATFTQIRALHNSDEADEISLIVAPSAKSMLVAGQRYIIAYQRHRRVGKGEPRRYEPFPDGPVLLTEQGANPAVFPYHEQLERSLSADPAAAAAHPQQLIEQIFNGLELPELALKGFYLRELFNWTALHDELTASDYERLREVFAAPWLDAEMLVAFYEPRSILQTRLGLELLHERAEVTLAGSPVQLDLWSAQPNLLLEMLRLLASEQGRPLDQSTLSRWLYSNQHLVVEKALLLLVRQQPETAADVAEQALLSAALSSEVKRVLERFLQQR